MRNILLVNDDGYYAEGIQRLKAKLMPFGNIYTVAPMHAMSAKGVSITITGLNNISKIDDYNYVVDGTPADCVDYAVKELGIDFDLVVSGCNRGLNFSILSIWSGTIGACIEALYRKIPAIAFSACADNMEQIDEYAAKVVEYILDNNLLSRKYLLNVNLPYTKKAKGIKLSRLVYEDDTYFNREDGRLYANKDCDIDFKDPDSDLYHVSHGYISISPLSYSFFNDAIFNQVNKKFKTIDFKK